MLTLAFSARRPQWGQALLDPASLRSSPLAAKPRSWRRVVRLERSEKEDRRPPLAVGGVLAALERAMTTSWLLGANANAVASSPEVLISVVEYSESRSLEGTGLLCRMSANETLFRMTPNATQRSPERDTGPDMAMADTPPCWRKDARFCSSPMMSYLRMLPLVSLSTRWESGVKAHTLLKPPGMGKPSGPSVSLAMHSLRLKSHRKAMPSKLRYCSESARKVGVASRVPMAASTLLSLSTGWEKAMDHTALHSMAMAPICTQSTVPTRAMAWPSAMPTASMESSEVKSMQVTSKGMSTLRGTMVELDSLAAAG
mmetsp:Transcript_4966/g.13667  ORF Transcript_4966/g.13667 Transcript_4966/m.13667 type:complete len:314 (-) Transcript_4966:813-1754(-)